MSKKIAENGIANIKAELEHKFRVVEWVENPFKHLASKVEPDIDFLFFKVGDPIDPEIVGKSTEKIGFVEVHQEEKGISCMMLTAQEYSNRIASIASEQALTKKIAEDLTDELHNLLKTSVPEDDKRDEIIKTILKSETLEALILRMAAFIIESQLSESRGENPDNQMQMYG